MSIITTRFLISITVAVNLLVMMIILIFVIRKYNKGTKKEEKLKKIVITEKRNDQTGELVFLDDKARRFNVEDVFKASAEGLGKGSLGSCYKAMMEFGEAVVVKRLNTTGLRGLNCGEFVKRVMGIADQSRNQPFLLPILACYYSRDEKLFLYPFASGGSLHTRLHAGRGTPERVPFTWISRLATARAIARAIDHLHQHAPSKSAAPHGNLKSSNVLFDHNDAVLIADYGLRSIVSLTLAERMVSYKTPEYRSHKKISKKSDVWSYGCLLMELLTGMIPGSNGVDMCGWVYRAVREEWTAEIFDPEIVVHRGANQGMLRLMRIALRCCEKLPEKRPEMGQVVAEVEKVVDSDDGYSGDSYSSSVVSYTTN